MIILRWGTRGVLITFFLLSSAIPELLQPRGQAAPWRAQEPQPASPPSSDGPDPRSVVHFVPTPMEVVEKMLEVARVTPKDVVYDLGSGDGRIVILAAKKYGAKAVGVELDPKLARESAEQVKRENLDSLVTILQEDLFQADIKPATVMTLYLLPSVNDRLRPILEETLKPGARVVTHSFPMQGWKASREETIEVGGGGGYSRIVYLYQIPEAFQR